MQARSVVYLPSLRNRYVIGLQRSLLAGIEPVVVTARALALDIGSAEKAKAWNQATAKVG